MAKARTVSTADGATHLFPVSFPLPPVQGRAGVNVYVHSATDPHPGAALATSAFSWVSDGQVNITAAPGAGNVVDIRRATLDTTLENIFQAGGSMRAQDLVQNDTQLLYLIQEREDFDDDLQSQLDAEVAARGAAVANEAATRAAADTAETTARSAADTAITASLNAETAARVAQGTALNTAITNETATRVANDNTLTANLAAEVANRGAGDLALGTRIDNEASTRALNDAALATALAGAGVSLTSATLTAVDRTALALLNHANGLPAYLVEAGREGMFYPTLVNVSTYVAADTAQGIYVPFSSDPTGASGAWVRRNAWVWMAPWFGMVGDALASGTGTSNTAAFNSAIALGALLPGCEIMFPIAAGHYRFATAPNEITAGIKITGQGWHENPGSVNGTAYPVPRNYTGSVCRFDADVKGFVPSAFTNQNANATSLQFQSATPFIMRDIMLLSLGGVGITAHGLDPYVPVHLTNVRIYGFAGNGLNLTGNTAGALRYGTTDVSQIVGCVIDANKLHGMYLDGNDNNVIRTAGTSFRNNGGAAVLDTTIVGNNKFDTCHATTNNRSHPTNSASGFSAAQIAKVQADAPCLTDNMTGGYIQYRGKIYNGTDIGNASAYVDCYLEGGSGSLSRLRSPTIVDGGLLGQAGSRHSEWTAQTRNFNEVLNFVNFTNIDQGANFVFSNASMKLTRTSALDNTTPTLTIAPQAANFSQFAMQGNLGSAALGLNVIAGTGLSQFSADQHYFKNAAQSLTMLTMKSTGIAPGTDNTLTSGSASFRWSQLYAGTATINTSDERHKDAIDAPSDTLLDAWAEVSWDTYKFKDAVEAKGTDGARIHIGLVAQRVRDTLAQHDIDGFALGLLCHDHWDDQYELKTEEQEFEETERVLDPSVPEGYRLETTTTRRMAPVLDADGNPEMILVKEAGEVFGMRYEEALSLEAALQRRNNQRLTTQLADLTARVDALVAAAHP